jgi:hypothetical protein
VGFSDLGHQVIKFRGSGSEPPALSPGTGSNRQEETEIDRRPRASEEEEEEEEEETSQPR